MRFYDDGARATMVLGLASGSRPVLALVSALADAMAPELGVDLADECARAIAAVGALEGPDALADAATCAIDHRRREPCYGWPVLDADQAAALMGRVRDVLAKVAA